MMRDFQQISVRRLCGHKALHLFLQIACQQRPRITIADQQCQGIIICTFEFGCQSAGGESTRILVPLQSSSSPATCLANSNMILICHFIELQQRRGFRIDANPQF